MFGLFTKKKKFEPFNYAALKTDMHAHLLPGIDDGAPNLDTSVELITGLQELGYSKLIATPHIFWDLYKNTNEIILSKLDLLREALRKRQINIEITAAAEYFLDDHFSELLQKKQPLLTLRDNIVLVEFSVMNMSMRMKDVVFDLQMSGYQPVLAHPERYTYLFQQYDLLYDLKENGCQFQLNLLSVSGGYGKTVSEMANFLLKNDFYDYLGTDLHHSGHLQRLKTLSVSSELNELVHNGRIQNSTL